LQFLKWLFVLCGWGVLSFSYSDEGTHPSPKIAIIMDDMGYSHELGLQALALPGDITYSFIAYAPSAKALARRARALDKEIMLHLPMASQKERPLDEGAITAETGREEIKRLLDAQLQRVPGVKGFNNHMGSALTESRVMMSWLMEAVVEHDLYFVDSRTSRQTVAYEVAKEYGVPALQRQVFLDHAGVSLQEQLERALKLARQGGQAVAIAHPYPESMAFLADELDRRLSEQGVELVFVSELLLR